MTTAGLGKTTLQAIKCLKPRGAKSFERLTATLLSQLIKVPIRLCDTGYQAGIDARAEEIPLAIEDKRYQENSLDLRELEGELAAAARRYPDLQLWMLVSTTELDPAKRDALGQTGETLGLGVFVLDSATAQPYLPGIPAISALCAMDIGVTLQAMSDQEWLDARRVAEMPSVDEVEADLKGIRELSRFAEWMNHLRATVIELPVWRLIVERQNRRLAKILEEKGTFPLWGTDFDPNKVVPRTAKNKINGWLNSAIKTPEPDIAVVLGERFDGKTWCVFDWLRAGLTTLSLPVFFIGSNRGINGTKSLEDHILDDIKRVLGSFERHAEATVRRQRDIKAGSTPWCLVILDGLNEYLPSFNKCLEHTVYASGRIDLDSRPCAVLATVRRQSWMELDSQIQGKKQLIEIGPYDEAEFQAAVRLRGLPDDYLASLPDTVYPLVRRPRYLGLVIDHKDQLRSYDAITPDVLHWLDACDKVARSRPAPAPRWDAESYQEILKNLAALYSRQGVLNLTEIQSAIGTLASDPRSTLEELRSEGVLTKTSAGYQVSGDRLALGMGIYLLERLEAAYEKDQSLVECLRDLLAPAQETEEMISWLRAAATIALLKSPATSEAVLDTLVNEWLRSRNLSRQDFQEIKAVRRLLLHPLLRLAEKTWSFETGEPRLQELSRMVFTDVLTEHKDLISEAVRSWFRLIPRAGSATFQHLKKENDPEGIVRAEVATEDLTDLNLRIWGDEGILMLHRVGLHLVDKMPDLVEPKDLLALLVAKAIAFDSLGDGDCFVLRRALARADTTWFATQAKQALKQPTGRRRKSLSSLIPCADRADLVEFAEEVKLPADPHWELWERGWIRNRNRYEEVHCQPFAEEDNPGHFIREVQELVCDPSLPRPCDERLAIIREVLTRTFADVELGTSCSQTIKDAEFERMLPAMAVWAPDIGADIIRRQMRSLLSRLRDRQYWWAYSLRENVVLVCGAERSALSEALNTSNPNETGERLALGYILMALLPGMEPHERVEALIKHPLGNLEWSTLYEFAVQLLDPDVTTYLVTRMRQEGDPLLVRRIRNLLGLTKHIELTTDDASPLLDTIAQGSEEDRFASLSLVVASGIKNIPVEILLPLAANNADQHSRIPGYAAWLLIERGALASTPYESVIALLPPFWRAVAAIKRVEIRDYVLQEIDLALDPEKPLEQKMFPAPVEIDLYQDGALPGRRRHLSPEAFTHSVHFRQLESSTGGIAGWDNQDPRDVFETLGNSQAASERLRRIQNEVAKEFVHRSKGHMTCWGSEQFPLSLMDQIYEQERSRFDSWLEVLLADKTRARLQWYGLAGSMFRTAIRAGDLRARDLWSLVSPFQRKETLNSVRFILKGIDWVFHELSNQAACDEIATTLLRELAQEALSDQELFHVALGARHQEQKRLAKIVDEFLGHKSAEMRARAVKIAGWLEDMAESISGAEHSDPSLWVRKVAADAFKSQQLETWARHWFDVFLKETRTEIRWGAGQLFLACIDSRFHAWAWQVIRQLGLTDRIRGEAFLLLDEARKETERREQKLRDTFLQHKLNDLKAVCGPWHPSVDWEELAVTQ